jgi:putative endonuclease
MSFFTYVLYSELFDRLYIGQTDNLEKRLHQHNSGKVPSTKPYLPYRLVQVEEFSTRVEALKREKTLKLGKERIRLRKIITKVELIDLP